MNTPTDDLRARLSWLLRDCVLDFETGRESVCVPVSLAGFRDTITQAIAALSALPAGGEPRLQDGDVHTIACVLAREDGYDPADEHGGLYDLRWSGGPNPEPEGDAWQMDYMPKAERIVAALGGTTTPQPSAAEAHPDDLAVDRFAAAMKAKLAKKRAEGRGGWDDPAQCPVELLSNLLHEHVAKGDPVDVGNLAMMLHQRDSGVLPPQGDLQSDLDLIWHSVSDTKETNAAHARLQAALTRQPVAGDGMVLVPREPTPAMLIPLVHRSFQDHWEAGKRLQSEQLHRSSVAGNYGYQDWMIPPKTEYEVAAGQYLAMLAAAPAATPTDGGEGNNNG